MWKVLVLCVVPGCTWLLEDNGREEDERSAPPPAEEPAPPAPCTGPPGPLCISDWLQETCGNGQIDSCFYQLMPGHCYYIAGGVEGCDVGTPRRSCVDLGFTAGETTCLNCRVDTSACTN